MSDTQHPQEAPNEQMDSRIDSFMRGQMNAEEEQAFKNQLQTDASLRTRCREQLLLIRHIQQVGAQRDKEVMTTAREITPEQIIEAVGESQNSTLPAAATPKSTRHTESLISTTDTPQSTRRTGRIISMIVAPLALAAIAIGAFFLLRNPHNDEALQFALTHSELMLTAGSDDIYRAAQADDEVQLQELHALYKRVQQEEPQLLGQDTEILQAHFSAATNDILGDDICDEHPCQVGWFLALAHLRAGQPQQARHVLMQCMAMDDSALDDPLVQQAMEQLLSLIEEEP